MLLTQCGRLALTWLLMYTQTSAFLTKPLTRQTSSALRAEISVVLEKPLGLLLEEDENEKGVYVKEILDSGSAATCEDINEGWRVVSAGGIECAELNLEQVMAAIGSAPSPVELRLKSTTCLLKVVDPDKGSTFVSAQIGDNLRTVLLQSGAKIYDFKGVLTNCNGGGQCGACVVAIDNAPEFSERPDWEAKKLKGRPNNHRISCQVLVAGDKATVTLRPPRT